MTLQETDSQQVIKLQQALDKIKVNTLYLQLIEEHKAAKQCLETMLILENQLEPLVMESLSRTYMRLTDRVNKLHIQLLFLKSK